MNCLLQCLHYFYSHNAVLIEILAWPIVDFLYLLEKGKVIMPYFEATIPESLSCSTLNCSYCVRAVLVASVTLMTQHGFVDKHTARMLALLNLDCVLLDPKGGTHEHALLGGLSPGLRAKHKTIK